MRHYTQDEIAEYLDEELPIELASEVKAHLGECSECSEIAFRLKSYSNLIRHSQFTESDEFVSESMTKLNNRELKKIPLRRRTPVSEIVIASLSFILSIFLLVNRPFSTPINETSDLVDTESLLMSALTDEEIEPAFSFSSLIDIDKR